jgi:DNA replication protein DnaC
MQPETDNTPRHKMSDTTRCVYCGEPADLVCDDCEARNERENAKRELMEAAAKERRRAADFDERVGAYADTVLARLPSPALRAAVELFNPATSPNQTIIGPSRTGKTRAAVLMIRAAYQAGQTFQIRQAGEMRRDIMALAREGKDGPTFQRLATTQNLLIDDFGNTTVTRSAEEMWLALLEARSIRKRRTFVTSQYEGPELRASFTTAQMADAIMARIGREYATITKTSPPTP